MPRRQPRWPSMGLTSCNCSTRFNSVRSSFSLGDFGLVTSSLPISTIRSSRRGRNSCSGGSMVRMVTGETIHGAKDADEVIALHGKQFAQRIAAVFLVVGENHGPHVRQAVLGEEHVLSTAQPY